MAIGLASQDPLSGLLARLTRPIMSNLPDFLMAPGSPEQAYKDGCNSFKLLKSGGLMVFDDYLIDYTLVPEYAHYGSPKEGINKFLNEYSNKIKNRSFFSA